MLRLPRAQGRALWLAIGGLLIPTLLLLVRGQNDRSSQPTGEPFLPLAPEVQSYTRADTVRRGDTLGGLLFRNQVGLQQIDRILGEIRRNRYFDPRSIHPGQVFEFTHDEAGGLVGLTCRVSPERIFVFEGCDDLDSLSSYAQAVDYEVRIRKLSGSIHSTFEEALLAAGGRVRLAVEVSEIFSGDIDFFTDVQRGDEFSLLVEERFVDGAYVDYGKVLYGWYRGKEASAACVYFQPDGSEGGHYDLEGGSLRRAFLRSPLNYKRISSSFTSRRYHPILKRYRPHHGVDYAAPSGTPVVSVADGVVTHAGWKAGYGKVVEIRHSPTHSTCYGHLNRFAKGIQKGRRVEQGQKIGYVGMTGLATGPHLHYEMRMDGRPINPLRMKTVPAEPVAKHELPEFLKLAEEMKAADQVLEAGALLTPQRWEGILLAQNEARDSGATAD